MLNGYTALKNAKHHQNDLLREAEHNRLVRQALGPQNGTWPFAWGT